MPAPIPRRGIQKTITLDPEAAQWLMRMASGPNCQGRYVSRILMEEKARQFERAQWEATLAPAETAP
jgi:hypothetical protein